MVPRDFQRKRVYAFEDFYTNKNQYARVFALTKSQCKDMVNKILSDYGHSDKIVHVTFFKDTSALCYMLDYDTGLHINMPRWSQNATYLLHEITHGLVGFEYGWNYEAAHGPIFLATLIDLLEYYCDYDGKTLRKEALAWKLKIADKKLIPQRLFKSSPRYRFKQQAA